MTGGVMAGIKEACQSAIFPSSLLLDTISAVHYYSYYYAIRRLLLAYFRLLPYDLEQADFVHSQVSSTHETHTNRPSRTEKADFCRHAFRFEMCEVLPLTFQDRIPISSFNRMFRPD